MRINGGSLIQMNEAASVENNGEQALSRRGSFRSFLSIYFYRLAVKFAAHLSAKSEKWRLIHLVRRIAAGLVRLRYSSAFVWMSTTLIGLLASSFLLSFLAYGFAHSGHVWFIYLWDHGFLGLYSMVRFHHYWWLFLPAGITAVIFAARPWKLYRIGGWSRRHWVFMWRYTVLFAFYLFLVWQLHFHILNPSWVLALSLALVCHFFAILTFSIFCCLSNRCPPLNSSYIELTRKIILDGYLKAERSAMGLPRGWGAVNQLFQSSMYGYLVQQTAETLFDSLLGRWMIGLFRPGSGGRNRLNRIRRIFVRFLLLLSLARVFDVLFSEHFYVMHFEMVLRDLLAEERDRSWTALNRERLGPALLKHSVAGIFIKKDSDG